MTLAPLLHVPLLQSSQFTTDEVGEPPHANLFEVICEW